MIKDLFGSSKPKKQNAPSRIPDFDREHAIIIKQGKRAIDEGRQDEAMRYFQEAEELCLSRGDKDNLAASHDMQSVLLRKLGMPNEALRHLWASERIYFETGNRSALADCFAAQAIIHRELGQRHFAVGLLKREEWIWREIADFENLILCYDRLAALYDEMGLPQFVSGVLKEKKVIRETPEKSGKSLVIEHAGGQSTEIVIDLECDQPKEED